MNDNFCVISDEFSHEKFKDRYGIDMKTQNSKLFGLYEFQDQNDTHNFEERHQFEGSLKCEDQNLLNM